MSAFGQKRSVTNYSLRLLTVLRNRLLATHSCFLGNRAQKALIVPERKRDAQPSLSSTLQHCQALNQKSKVMGTIYGSFPTS